MTAGALAIALLAVDASLDREAAGSTRWLYAGGPDGARSLLSTVAGAIITVIGVVFSITIVSLQLAAQQLGPRLLRTFIRDVGNQVFASVASVTRNPELRAALRHQAVLVERQSRDTLPPWDRPAVTERFAAVLQAPGGDPGADVGGTRIAHGGTRIAHGGTRIAHG